jgi:hypothetical protein
VSELSGLPVSLKETGADVKADFLEFHAYLCFACASDEQLELYTYRHGTVKEWAEKWSPRSASGLQWLQPHEGSQAVYLRSYLGEEPTLMMVTVLALGALGGRPWQPISEAMRRDYGTPITAAQLQARRRKMRKQAQGMALVVIFLLPLLLPLFVIELAWFVVMMPWRLGKAYWQAGRHEMSIR